MNTSFKLDINLCNFISIFSYYFGSAQPCNILHLSAWEWVVVHEPFIHSYVYIHDPSSLGTNVYDRQCCTVCICCMFSYSSDVLQSKTLSSSFKTPFTPKLCDTRYWLHCIVLTQTNCLKVWFLLLVHHKNQHARTINHRQSCLHYHSLWFPKRLLGLYIMIYSITPFTTTWLVNTPHTQHCKQCDVHHHVTKLHFLMKC